MGVEFERCEQQKARKGKDYQQSGYGIGQVDRTRKTFLFKDCHSRSYLEETLHSHGNSQLSSTEWKLPGRIGYLKR